MPVSDVKSIIQGIPLLQIYTDGGVSFLLQTIESEKGGRILKVTGAVSLLTQRCRAVRKC